MSINDEYDEQLRRLDRRIEQTNNEQEKRRLKKEKKDLVEKPKMK